MRGRTFTREFKLEVVRQIESGAKRPAQVCREHHLAETVLLRWRREYEERGEVAFTPHALDGQASSPTSAERRIAELERLCGQLALENAALKKALQHLQARPGVAAPSAGR
jgi:transposase-like protein